MMVSEMNKENLERQINSIETELEQEDLTDASFEFLNAELQDLYCKLDRLNDWATDIDY